MTGCIALMLSLSLVSLLLLLSAVAFEPPLVVGSDGCSGRRHFLGATGCATVAAIAIHPASAAVLDSSNQGRGTTSTLTIEEAEDRFRAGRESVRKLLSSYDLICEGGGDNVR